MEKSEFDKLPQGMTGEELDVMIADEEQEAPEVIAQEALDATKESSPAEESVTSEGDVKDKTEAEETVVEEVEEELSETDQQLVAKDAVIGDFRRKNRDLEVEKARLEGELSGRKSQAPVEKPKSPLEIAEAAYKEEHETLDGFAMDGALYRKQRAFDDEQAASQTAVVQEEQALNTMNRSVQTLQAGELSSEKVGDGLDFKSIVALGKDYLDKADLLKIEITSHKDGIPAGVRKTYELCKEAILAANNEDTKLLQNAMKSKSQAKPKKKTDTKQADVDALITGGDINKGEAETDVPTNTRLANFICSPE